jgi:hypothetical protein
LGQVNLTGGLREIRAEDDGVARSV